MGGNDFFRQGVVLDWKEDLCIVKAELDDGALIENVTRGREERYTSAERLSAWSREEMQFVLKGPSTRALTQGEPPTEYIFTDFAGLSDEIRDEAWRGYDLIRPYLSMTRKQRSAVLKAVDANAASEEKESFKSNGHQRWSHSTKIGQAESASSIRWWSKRFRESGGDIRSLVPRTKQRGGNGKPRLDHAVEAIINDVLGRYKLLVMKAVVPAVSVDLLYSEVVTKIETANIMRGFLAKANDQAPSALAADSVSTPVSAAPIPHRNKQTVRPGEALVDENGSPLSPLKLSSRNTVATRVYARNLGFMLERQLSDLEKHGEEQAQAGPRLTHTPAL